jgi:hypothetical protein
MLMYKKLIKRERLCTTMNVMFQYLQELLDGVGRNIDVANVGAIGFCWIRRDLIEFVRDLEQGGMDVRSNLEFQVESASKRLMSRGA